jgi:hypothetical protein
MEVAVGLDVSVQTVEVAVLSVAVMVVWAEAEGLHAQTRIKARRIRNDLDCIVFFWGGGSQSKFL